MEEKEVLQKIDEVGKKFEETIKGINEGFISKSEANKRIEDVNKLANDLFATNKAAYDDLKKDVMEILKKQGEDISLMKSKSSNIQKSITFADQLKSAFEQAGLIEPYQNDLGSQAFKLKGCDNQTGKFQLKAAIDMTTTLALAPGSSPGTNIGYLTNYGMNRVQLSLSRDLHFMDVFPVQTISQKYFGVVIEHTFFDGADIKAEGSTAGESSFKLKTIEYKVMDIPARFRVAKNNLEDIPFLMDTIARKGSDALQSKIDEYTLYASGDNSSTPYGLRTSGYFTAFDPSTWTGKVESANLVDVIIKQKLQAELADKFVNAVILYPSAIDEIETLKDANRNYLQSRGIVFDNDGNLLKIKGLTVIKNKKLVNADTSIYESIVLNGFDSLTYGVRDNMNIEIGWDGNDFSQRMVTVMLTGRVAFGIGDPETIIYSDNMQADKDVLNNPEA